MLKIFVRDAWITPWIFFEDFCSEFFETTLQDVYNMPKMFYLVIQLKKKIFFIRAIEICKKQEILIKSCRYWLLKRRKIIQRSIFFESDFRALASITYSR